MIAKATKLIAINWQQYNKKILSHEININEMFDIRDIKDNIEFYELDLFIDREDETGRAILYFDKNTLDLKKWELIDEFENKTVLEFTRLKKIYL